MTTLRRHSRGLTLIFSLILVMTFGIVLMALLGMANHQSRALARHSLRQEEFAAAELGLNKTYAELRHFLEFGTQPLDAAIASITPPSVPGIQYSDFEVIHVSSQNEVPTSGPFVGLTLYTTTYKSELTARSTAGTTSLLAHPGVSVRQDLKIRYVPLYIYGIFYDPDLEILPGPTFTETGRVHTNGDMYVGTGATLTFLNYVTAHGDITHGYHPFDTNHTTQQTGDVRYWLSGSNGLTDLVSGVYLDHDNPAWNTDAYTRWNGHVLDSAHAMPELPLPIPDVEDPHVLIEPAQVDDPVSVQQLKFNNLADLVITVDAMGNVTGTNHDGNPVDLTYDHDGNPATPRRSIYTLSTFMDNREGHDVTTLDLNVGYMIEGNIDPANGIVYVNYTGGVRMTNGATLPTNVVGGFTVATSGPMYVLGDYNTSNTKLSLLAGDAINILSNGWVDSDSYLPLANPARDAVNSQVRSVLLAGNVPTDADTPYSGGVENYFRFHEDWGGRTFTFRGSIINLWDSEVATANWVYGSPVYNAPNRDWNWDIIYGGLAGPPGMPRVFFIDRLEWQEVDPTT